jgi:hypothetical protein
MFHVKHLEEISWATNNVSRETFGVWLSLLRWVFFGNAGDGRTLSG